MLGACLSVPSAIVACSQPAGHEQAAHALFGKTERLVEICRHFGADSFLEGDAGKSYIDDSLFTNAGITLEYQHYHHPTYQQLHGEFIPYLSVVDLLFNHGKESRQIVTAQIDK